MKLYACDVEMLDKVVNGEATVEEYMDTVEEKGELVIKEYCDVCSEWSELACTFNYGGENMCYDCCKVYVDECKVVDECEDDE